MATTLSYEEYENIDKEEVEEVIKDLTKEFFDKYESLEFINMDFDNYWEIIEDNITNYPHSKFITKYAPSSNSKIYLLVDWKLYMKNNDENNWQRELYNEMGYWFSFFRLPRTTPWINFIDKN